MSRVPCLKPHEPVPPPHRRRARARCLSTLCGALALGCTSQCEAPEQKDSPATIVPPSRPKVAPAAPVQRPLGRMVEELRRSNRVTFVEPTNAERSEYRRWVGGVDEAARAGTLPSTPPPEGFLGRWADSGTTWLLAEAPDTRRGAGLVAIRPASRRRVIIEAPHSYFDVGTLELSMAAFEQLSARALLVNTFHRGGRGSKEERTRRALSGESPSDVAHNARSFFAAAHEELVKAEPGAIAVQLHGFRDDAAPDVDAIVSASRTRASPQLVAAQLGPVLGKERVAVYPDQIRKLGGTQNVQAQLSRKLDAGFIHLELSASVRTRLNEDTELRRRFLEALQAGLDLQSP